MALLRRPTRESRLRVGLVGLGQWGRKVLSVLREFDVSIVVASSNPEASSWLRQDETLVSDWRDLEGARLDGVIIATPPATHGSLLYACDAWGVPALVEKPLCLDYLEALELHRRLKIPVLVDHILLFHEGFRRLREFDPQVRLIRCEGGGAGPIRDVPVLWDWGPHDVALTLGLIGEFPHAVVSVGNSDYSVVYLDFGSGLGSFILNSRIGPVKERRLTVWCEKEVYVIDFLGGPGLVRFSEVGSEPEVLVQEVRPPLVCVLEEFLDGIRSKTCDWRSNLAFGVDVVSVLTLAQRSAETITGLIRGVIPQQSAGVVAAAWIPELQGA